MDNICSTEPGQTQAVFKNPITASIAALTETLNTVKAGFDSASEIVIAIETLIADAQAQAELVASSILELQIKLPLAKAMDAIEQKAKIAQGIVPACTGGEAFKSVAAGVSGAVDKIRAFVTTSSAGLQAALAEGEAAMIAAVGELNTTMAQHVQEVSSALSEAQATLNASIENLKAYAFTKFCALPQPPYIRELLDLVVCPQSVPSAIAIRLDEHCSRVVQQKRYTEAYNSPVPSTSRLEAPVAPVPVTNTVDVEVGAVNGQPFKTFKINFMAFLEAKQQEAKTLGETYNALAAIAAKARDSVYPIYFNTKSSALNGDEASKGKYAENKEYYAKMPEHIAAMAAYKTWEASKDNVERLIQLWTTWSLREFKDVPAGPAW